MDFSKLGRIPDSLLWIGVDFFNTLFGIPHVDGPKTAWEVLRAHGIEVGINDLWPVYRALELEDLLGRIDTNERYARLLADLKLFSNTDPSRNRKLILALRAAEKRDLMSGLGVLMGAVEFLEWAESRNLALILVSNVTEVGLEVQEESGLMGFFKTSATSRYLHAAKSSREGGFDLFEVFCLHYDLDVKAGIIIDDEERWLLGAHKAGLCTALLRQAWSASRDLQPPLMPGIDALDFAALQRELEALL